MMMIPKEKHKHEKFIISPVSNIYHDHQDDSSTSLSRIVGVLTSVYDNCRIAVERY